MSSVLRSPGPQTPVAPSSHPDRVPPRRRTRVLALPEARWALAALLLFLAALPLYLLDAPAWLWGPLFAATYATGGWEPGWEGLKALGERTLDVDLLMVVAALGAAAIGQVLDGALLIVIFATSGALEAVATARTADSVRGLLDLAPETATRLADDGTEEVVPAGSLAVGDVVLVRPGERIGGDGRVLDGASDVDQATITGEPLPVAKQPGDEVFAGTLNGSGALRVRVERDPSESVIARIVAMVEEAAGTKAPTQLFIEKVEQRYSLAMVAVTLLIFTIPLLLGSDLRSTLLRAMTFMIVASPCAVVLATMPPLLSAMANAGRHGVLVKSAVVMERLGQIDAVALDKTGTLTEGTPHVTDVHPLAARGHDVDALDADVEAFDAEDFDADALLRFAAAAEYPSEHPLARAVVEAARARGVEPPAAEDFASTPGTGVTATVDGRTVAVGSPARLLGDPAHPAAVLAAGLEAEGRTAVVVTVDGRPAGVLGIADRLRPGAAAATRALAGLTGRAPVLVTGDNPRAAARLAADVGITDVRAGLLPQDKVAAVHELRDAGAKVLVVGDGVNDAPALAAAHIGVAMGRAGSDLALETADAVVVRDELAAIPTVVNLSRRARALVIQNLVIAGTFIAVLAVWDLVGTLPLPLGVAGHEGSTVLVGLNGLRLLADGAWRRSRPTPHQET
ncbi:heavy metal translocating P-type ATPase [Streptomyces sp. R302]|uniref:heavy metal translocating P-type ATPase n=1 Tax=unclassified Streptomyces TaxID=2593676 RepID=UPI00145FCBD5|nr:MULTISPECIES: heavy metal translocating P-type ATPase [unclassified Streptomyces]NML55275.1 heavy metal translocating P-type ATPase [Streptomyces sp. R301]NML82695.1 heavy metal translocating P-type ATPase [Streptomyces sp. R302]